MARLFLAVWPPDDVISTIESLPRKDQRGARFVPPERWHLTLRFLGEARAAEVIDSLDGADLPTPTVRLGPAVDVLDQRSLVIPASGLDELAEVVTRRTRDLGTEPVRRRFVGHLTLARVKPTVPMPRALGALIEAEFVATEVALVQSTLRPDGPRYDTLMTWEGGS